jgi:hypothetical protein
MAWQKVEKTGDAFLGSTITDLDFAGIAGWDCVMERDADLVPPWEDLPEPIRAGPDGWVTFDDLGPGVPARRFYRMREAP